MDVRLKQREEEQEKEENEPRKSSRIRLPAANLHTVLVSVV